MKKTIAKLLYGLLVFACIFNVANASMQASRLLTRYDGSVSASGSTLTIAFEVVGTSIMDEIGVNEITVQRYNGSSWVTVRTFIQLAIMRKATTRQKAWSISSLHNLWQEF